MGARAEAFLSTIRGSDVYLPPKTWGSQYDYAPDAALLVFASHAYDANDYIRDYEAFRKLVAP